MKKFTKILLAALLIASFAANAQDEEESSSPLEISGSVDTYYFADFSDTKNRTTWFAEDQAAVGIGMIDLALSKTVGKATFVGELGFGPRGDGAGDNTGLAATAAGSIQNLYVSYAFSDKFSMTGGFMGTFVGYEVISPAANFNYTASYLFSNGPFQNAGVRADYAFSDKVSLMVGVFGTQWDSYSYTGMDNFGTQLTLSPVDGLDIYLNYITGSQFKQWDITAGYQATDALYIGANVSQNMEYGDDPDGGFFGAAAYLQYGISDSFALGLRYENFAYEFDGAPSINSLTLSGNIFAGPLTIIPEIRFDSSDQDIFVDADDAGTGSFIEAGIAAVFAF
ncbi:porin [Reichenbachiella agarivorans]|uniref:Porin n=1 Tax=Reichenbachiella agarivorans TaxID=2979464 RepID=A0ABY6CUV9_9BACT|nr:porin [Reichenbachiella agarivorans]UXP33163.1 porin [Reichenbachiella agarivorans]